MKNKAQMDISQIDAYLSEQLVFAGRETFTSRDEGCLQQALCLQHVDGALSLLGYVSKLGKRYWWFTNHPMLITCADPTITFKTCEEAERELYEYVRKECRRILLDGAGIVRFTGLPNRAQQEADISKSQVDVLDSESYEKGFINGFCKAVTFYGLNANPKWANYLVQNRDGSFTWFENKPKCDHNLGKWYAESGKKRTVKLTNSWSHSIRRL